MPAFPESINDPNYSFLGREARELTQLDLVDLLVIVVDGDWTGAQPDGFEVRALRRPKTHFAKVKSLLFAFRAEPMRLASFAKNPRASYPTLWRIGALVQLIGSWKPDVVHSHFAVPNGTCGLPVARALRAASVVSLRGVDLATDERLGYGFRLDEIYEREFRASVANVDLCLTATDHMRGLAIAAGAVEERAIKLPNSIESFNQDGDDELVSVVRPSGANCVLLSVGHLIELKGFDRGIRALALLPEDHHYLIIGEGVDRAALERLAIELGVAERTHLIGEVSPASVVAWMKESDCYWFLSIVEAFGNVAVEAFAAALPIVATSVGVAPELAAADPSVQLLVEPYDPIDLVELTYVLLGTSVSAARTEVLKGFSPQMRSSSLVGHYRTIVLGQ